MDDAKIEEIRRAVLSRLSGTPSERAVSGLESRVAALEAQVAELKGASRPAAGPPPRGRVHPSLVVVTLPPEADPCAVATEPGRCVLEPEKTCTLSGACRTFGH
jgi:hypothetical protein